jgi:hypothetical protein
LEQETLRRKCGSAQNAVIVYTTVRGQRWKDSRIFRYVELSQRLLRVK